MEWVKEGEEKGEGREEGNACRQTPGFWKPPTHKQRCHAVINKPILKNLRPSAEEVNFEPKQNLQSKQVKRSTHEWINKFFYCKFDFSNNFNNPFAGWIMENFKSNLSSKLEFRLEYCCLPVPGRRENFTGLLICIICRNLSNNANAYLSTLPVLPGVSKFFIKSPGLQVRAPNLPGKSAASFEFFFFINFVVFKMSKRKIKQEVYSVLWAVDDRKTENGKQSSQIEVYLTSITIGQKINQSNCTID